MTSVYTAAEWAEMKRNAAMRWQSVAQNPLLPPAYREERAAYFFALEETADNALDLIAKGYSLEEATSMASDWLEWKLSDGGAR